MGSVPRTGFVSLIIDDSHDYHYTYVYPLLEQHGFKGNFGYITEMSDLGIEGQAYKMQEIYQAGHEVMDHTTRHDYRWATHVDTLDDALEEWIPYAFADIATWDSLCNRSLFILDSLGIVISGWNHPGGSTDPGDIPGHPEWMWRGSSNDSLYAFIGSLYEYAVASGVNVNTAHLNLRGHNCPDRYPFFNVPHRTVDGVGPLVVRTEIADAVASGLWYPALTHGETTQQLMDFGSLVCWLDQQDIEVLTCPEAIERITDGVPYPYENQLPQARMLWDRDENGKPDGFMGSCSWDTLCAVPVGGCNAMNVDGDTEFYCYGPEVGRNSFSVWMKGTFASTGSVRIIWVKLGFDWEYLEDCWNTVTLESTWTLIDSSAYSTLAFDVEDEVDRIKFIIRPLDGFELRAARPSVLLSADAGVGPADVPSVPGGRPLRVVPNPACCGQSVRILGTGRAAVYDVRGRRVWESCRPPGALEVEIPAAAFAPGVYFIDDREGDRTPAKVIIRR
jgi:hypothetical protein